MKTRLIRKYDNRKLYDTSEARYTSLDELFDLVEGGQPVKVFKKVDGKTIDVTRAALFDMIVQRQKTSGIKDVSKLNSFLTNNSEVENG